ncbi:MAG: AarF/UbiB family protein [Methylobacter sp.]|nr:AarF/UbiB family protein [Methylobacter sp.]MDP2427172.1 AarF/UbiB family protein [Methylobacter sp.]MDP3056679.1 AarF/UbiB family protein [Methylobacter sp.]MDP3364252.1 AarF/UbiB family protein [Methylobacter sp.]MDZ4219928.1 AarF/UbiB family protein [Methylobacter sp.]
MLWEMLNAARDLGRIHDIASVLIRYGFGSFVRGLGLGKALEQAGRVLHWQHAEDFASLDTPQRLRRVLEDLGPTFIKLGQILATRVDLFPPNYIAEFEKLQDQALPIPFEQLLPQLEEDLGGSVDEFFSHIDTQALAAASIAQVHKATLKDGTPVVLKIRRPGLRKIIEADLRLLQRLVDMTESESSEIHRYHPQEVLRQFNQSLRRELDLATECRNAERVAANFADDANIIIPKVYWQWTGERLNVQEYIAGIAGRDIAAIEETGLDRKLLADRGTEAVIKMIMEDGFFHADPHAGNVFYLPDNKLAFIDFGMIGRLTEERREQVVSLLYGMTNHLPTKVAEILEDWSDNIYTDEQVLTIEIEAFVDQYSSLTLKDLSLANMLGDLMALLRDHKLILPPDLALLIKAYITLDGLGRLLNPEFNTLVFAAPYVQRIMMERYRPDAIAKRGWRNLVSVADLLSSLPKDLRKLLRASRKGAIQVDITVRRLDQYVNHIDNAISRLTMGIVTAALIIGSSIIMTVKGGPELFGLPAFGFLGYSFATLGGIWLLLSIWKSGQ